VRRTIGAPATELPTSWVWGADLCGEQFIVAPLDTFREFNEYGMLLHNTYGEERDPRLNDAVYGAGDYVDAILEATHRIHRAGVPRAVAVRRGPRFEYEFIVVPVAKLSRMEEVGWRTIDEFHPE
jgi:hypothetical protein